MDIKNEIEQLRYQLHQYNYNYYVKNEPTISDYDFDQMMHRLQELEAAHPEFSDQSV